MIIIQLDSEQLNSVIQNAIRKVLRETPPQYQTTPTAQAEIVDIDEAANLLNLAKQTVYTLTSKREIQFFKRGKKLYFKRADLLKFIEDGKQKTVVEMQQDLDDHLSQNKKGKSIFSPKKNG